MTRVTRYIAFGTIRASAIDYRYASRDSRWGVVRFHKTRDAAERTVGSFGRVEVARIATREEIAADRAAKAAARAARAARDPFARPVEDCDCLGCLSNHACDYPE